MKREIDNQDAPIGGAARAHAPRLSSTLSENCSQSRAPGTHTKVSAPPETAAFDGDVQHFPTSESSAGQKAPWACGDADGQTEPRARPATERAPSSEIFPLVYRQMRSLAGGRADFGDLVQIAAEQALRVVVLHDLEGQSVEDIAGIVDAKVHTVR